MNNLIYSNNFGYENRESKSQKNNKKNKFDFNKYKKNTIHSLNDVECFLKNFSSFTKYVRLYKILK